MEASEIMAGVVSLLAGGAIWGLWLQRLVAVDPLVGKPGRAWVVPSALGAFTLVNVLVLLTLAASDVRHDPVYIGFYLVLGLGVSGLALLGLRLFGIGPEDISQRGNRAAAVFVVLAITASAFAYGGANIGEGPGFHVVLFCSLLSLGALFALLVLHGAIARTAYRILVDRDAGTAARVGCMLVACGICLGRAVGGTWHGLEGTLGDFGRYGWLAPVICALDLAIVKSARWRAPIASLPVDLSIGLIHLALAVAYVQVVGAPA